MGYVPCTLESSIYDVDAFESAEEFCEASSEVYVQETIQKENLADLQSELAILLEDIRALQTDIAPTVTATWETGTWGTCSATCGGGTQTRTVECSTGTAADCTETEPASSQDCNPSACPTWNIGSWGTCSVTCGGGTQTRTVECSTANAADCTETEPASSQDCNPENCPTWNTGSWDTCSVTCGGGTQTRTVECSTADSADCTETEPASSQDCNADACPAWEVGSWGACSVTCGGGTQVRDVSCSNEDASLCLATEPASSQDCGTETCACDMIADPTYLIVDVRSDSEWDAGHVDCAINIDKNDVSEWTEAVVDAATGDDMDLPIALYCASGNRAGLAKTDMESWGYTNVVNIGGYADVDHCLCPVKPTTSPSSSPSSFPISSIPSVEPSSSPSSSPESSEAATVTVEPSTSPSVSPETVSEDADTTAEPTVSQPSVEPSTSPSTSPEAAATVEPSTSPSASPEATVTVEPSTSPSASPEAATTVEPSTSPSVSPEAVSEDADATAEPTAQPTGLPSTSPETTMPSTSPETSIPSTSQPSGMPSTSPETTLPSRSPVASPSAEPSASPTVEDVDCDGSWSACNEECLRVWTETAAQKGNGAACEEPAVCESGDGQCVIVPDPIECTARDCNDHGTASGYSNSQEGCSCTCDDDWGGDFCETYMKMQQSVGVGGVTVEEVENNTEPYVKGYASSIGKSEDDVTVVDVVQVSTRRLLSTEVEIIFEVAVQSESEKTAITETVESDDFIETVEANIVSEDATLADSLTVLEVVVIPDPCSSIIDCSGHGSTADDDSSDGCECTCDAGWTSESDCSVADTVSSPSSSPTVVESEGDAGASTENSDSGKDFNFTPIIIGGIGLLACGVGFYIYQQKSFEDEGEKPIQIHDTQYQETDSENYKFQPGSGYRPAYRSQSRAPSRTQIRPSSQTQNRPKPQVRHVFEARQHARVQE